MSNGNRRPFAAALILAAAFGRDALAQGTTITLLDYHTTVPSDWVARAPSSSSRLAQFVLSGSDSTNNAEVVVFFFGKTQEETLTRTWPVGAVSFRPPTARPFPNG